MPNLHLLGIIDEDFINYKVPSMVLEFPICDFKCNKDAGKIVCQNMNSVKDKWIRIDIATLCNRYINNPISKAIVCQGLEPFDSFDELQHLIYALRIFYKCEDDIVIYTGYDYREIYHKVDKLAHMFKNIVIKYGRYIPDCQSHYDEVLGVYLASDNQYAERIS